MPEEPKQQKQQTQQKNRTMEKSERNWTRQIQKIYQNIFDYLHTYSTRRNSKSY